MTALLILAIISALIALACFLPIKFDICLYSGGQRIYLKYGIFRFRLIKGEKKHKKKKKRVSKVSHKESKQSQHAATPKKKNKSHNKRSLAESLQLIIDFLSPLPKTISYLQRGIQIKKLELYLSIAAEDAAQTAIDYGRYCAGISTFLPAVRNIFPLGVKAIKIVPNFHMKQTRYYIRFLVSVRFYRVFVSALRYSMSILKRLVIKKG